MNDSSNPGSIDSVVVGNHHRQMIAHSTKYFLFFFFPVLVSCVFAAKAHIALIK